MLLGKLEGEQVFLKPEEVYYFEAVDRKCFACLEEQVFQVEQGIQAVAEKYSELGFIRISKSIVVNIYRVRKIKADVNMKMQLVLDNGEKVILNRSYKNDFLQFIRERRNEHATH